MTSVSIPSFRTIVIAALLVVAGLGAGVDADHPRPDRGKEDSKSQSLFDGKKLGHWKATDFGGQGEVKVEDGNLVGSSRVDLQACKLEYSIVSPK